MAKVVKLSDHVRKKKVVYFDRRELHQLLSLYSHRVMGGQWRDYAIGHGDGPATFSIYRAALDGPIYQIIKFAPGAHREGDYLVCGRGLPLKRGRTLADVISVFEPPLRLVSP